MHDGGRQRWRCSSSTGALRDAWINRAGRVLQQAGDDMQVQQYKAEMITSVWFEGERGTATLDRNKEPETITAVTSSSHGRTRRFFKDGHRMVTQSSHQGENRRWSGSWSALRCGPTIGGVRQNIAKLSAKATPSLQCYRNMFSRRWDIIILHVYGMLVYKHMKTGTRCLANVSGRC